MLTVTIPATELFDERTSTFVIVKECKLSLEHSLVSISKWESKWKVPFISDKNKTNEQMVDYVRCMTITQNVDPNVYLAIPPSVYDEISKYIESPMTATWFSDKENKGAGREVITSEIIYYWMVTFNIPFECQKWHLNRLLTLIKVCAEKNKPKKNMSKNEILSRNRALNAARRKAMNTHG